MIAQVLVLRHDAFEAQLHACWNTSRPSSYGIGADPEQIRHRFGGSAIGIPEMLRVAKELGLKARARRSEWSRLPNSSLPAIAALKDGGFLFLGKVGDDEALVQSPSSPRPSLMNAGGVFEAVWDGRLVLMTRRAGLLHLSRRFDITWFLGAIHKYRRMLPIAYFQARRVGNSVARVRELENIRNFLTSSDQRNGPDNNDNETFHRNLLQHEIAA